MNPRWGTYNAGNASNRRVFHDFVRILREEQPALLALNEIADRTGILGRFAAWARREQPTTPLQHATAATRATGYRLVRDDSRPSSGKIATLVRPDVQIDRVRLVHLSPPPSSGVGRPAILVGDLNAALNRPRERSLLAPLLGVARLYAEPSHGRRAIDIFATDLAGSVRVLGGFSSDHRPAIFSERSP